MFRLGWLNFTRGVLKLCHICIENLFNLCIGVGILVGIASGFKACIHTQYAIGTSPAWNFIPEDDIYFTAQKEPEVIEEIKVSGSDYEEIVMIEEEEEIDEEWDEVIKPIDEDIKIPTKPKKPPYKTVKKNLKDTFLPQQKIIKKPLPSWIYSTAIIEVHFHDGSMRKGFATMLKNGLYLTSSELMYSDSLIPSSVFVKMQDTSADIIICAFKVGLKAVDVDSGLALLENVATTDDYCNVREKSFYHDRIQKKYAVDIFATTSNLTQNQRVFYSFIDDSYSFIPKSLKLGHTESYFDEKKHKEIVYGFNIEREEYENLLFGKGIFDNKGGFLGVVSLSPKSFLPVFVKKEVVQDFVCNLSEKSILNNADITHKCRGLKYRERYFLSKN